MKKAMLVSALLATALLGSFQAGGYLRAAEVPRASGSGARPSAPRPSATEPFVKAAIFLEFNETDNDTGVHIQTDHGDGLSELWVVSPDGRTVAEAEWRTRPPLGLTEMATESAEPDPTTAVRSYPAGVYRFFGRTIDGVRLASRATLSHALLPAPEITDPPDGATDVPTSGVVVTWNPVPGARGYMLEYEGDNPAVPKLETRLAASTTSFAIPDGFLIPDAGFKVGVASVHENGNLTLAAIEFRTAP